MKKHITTDAFFVKEWNSGELHEDYWIEKHSSLTLVYKITADGTVNIRPSVHLAGEYASATVIAIIAGGNSDIVHVSTLQHHVSPNTSSTLLVKSVMSQEAQCVYEGSIRVEKEAQKTDAYQRNENLLLDNGAFATSKPALEILANDVRCTHGAIVKTLSGEELWYLASRGIESHEARNLITEGFMKSALELIPNVNWRKQAESALPGGY